VSMGHQPRSIGVALRGRWRIDHTASPREERQKPHTGRRSTPMAGGPAASGRAEAPRSPRHAANHLTKEIASATARQRTGLPRRCDHIPGVTVAYFRTLTRPACSGRRSWGGPLAGEDRDRAAGSRRRCRDCAGQRGAHRWQGHTRGGEAALARRRRTCASEVPVGTRCQYSCSRALTMR
jgi:hypothetical protein